MNMSDQIIAVLDNLCAKFGIAIDWTSENVLPYVTELAGRYIKYEILTSIVQCASMVAVLLVLYKLAKTCHTNYKKAKASYTYEHDDDWEFAAIACIVLFCGTCIATLVFMPSEIDDIITCLTIPEKVIFEYLQSVM